MTALSEKQGLGIMKTFPDSVNNIREIKHLFPNQELKASLLPKQLVTLPTHNFVSFSDYKKVKCLLKTLHNNEKVN